MDNCARRFLESTQFVVRACMGAGSAGGQRLWNAAERGRQGCPGTLDAGAMCSEKSSDPAATSLAPPQVKYFQSKAGKGDHSSF